MIAPAGMLDFEILEYIVLAFILLCFLLPPYIGYRLAKSKNRPVFIWAFLCFIFPPLVILILCLSKEEPDLLQKKCPFCAEIILEEAIVCKHCGRDL